MRHTLTALTACLTLTACASAPLPIPGTYALIATYPDGNEYVIDYNLSDTDCAAYARKVTVATPTCEVQP